MHVSLEDTIPDNALFNKSICVSSLSVVCSWILQKIYSTQNKAQMLNTAYTATEND